MAAAESVWNNRPVAKALNMANFRTLPTMLARGNTTFWK